MYEGKGEELCEVQLQVPTPKSGARRLSNLLDPQKKHTLLLGAGKHCGRHSGQV